MKDIRLPEGFDSWTQLAKNVMSQDEINFNDNKQVFYRVVSLSPFLADSKPDDMPNHERFECDVLTLKLRAFDELKDIIPDAEELQQAMHEIFYAMHQGGNTHSLQESKAIKLLDSILKLVGGERYMR